MAVKDLSMLNDVDIHSEVAVYTQIENHIQFAIASGNLKAMDKLPSVRELSERLKVNPNTVAKAYRDLEVMGLLFTRRGMGVFVNSGVAVQCKSDCRAKLYSAMFEAASEGKAAGMTKAETLAVVAKSMASSCNPYKDAPATVLALAKAPRKSR